jgi:hypothetical protein
MTDDQFQAIIQYVTERLEAEESFAIPPDQFCEMFNLVQPYYSDFLSRLHSADVRFSCKAPWKDAAGDPSDPLRFELK